MKSNTINFVLYDPETRTWSRPQEGRFAHDAEIAKPD